ncbi:hypothetical protein AVEN_163368-1, partial [Araneus ventricosus]
MRTDPNPHPSSNLPGMVRTPHSRPLSLGGGAQHQEWIIRSRIQVYLIFSVTLIDAISSGMD